MSSTVRRPAVAGYFYPDDPENLRATVGRLLAEAECDRPSEIRALIAPHAGYVYSGPTAAHAYAVLDQPAAFKRVVLIGPAHRVPVRGLALPAAAAFETPLGEVALDRPAMAALLSLPQVQRSETAHLAEHSLEVHLPFLQTVLDDFLLVPLVVGDASGEEVAEVLDRVVDDNTLLVISSDLSHYLPYDVARKRDRQTIDRILGGETDLQGDQACGCRAINGLTCLARKRRWQLQLLDYRNSGDTAGDRDRVVGYAAMAVHDG